MSIESTAMNKIERERGAVLFLSLGMMVILLSLGLMFVGIGTSRQMITNNQGDAIKARCIAWSGIEYALSQLRADPGSGSDIGASSFGGGGYAVDISRLSETEVELTATAKYGSVTERVCVVVEIPPSSGTVYAWALREGDPAYSWASSYRAHDDARGPNADYALIVKGQKAEQGLAGFRIDNMAYPISKVEFVIHYFIPDEANFGARIEVRWRRVSDDKKCPWQHIDNPELIAAAPGGVGFVAWDITSEPPPEGWIWEVFTAEPDFEIEIKQKDFNDVEKLYIDCAGFRISWGGA
jgi:hypothetical protein